MITIPDTNTSVIVNCTPTSSFRKNTPLCPDLNSPFNALVGLNAEMASAGYMDDTTPRITVTPTKKQISTGDCINDTSFPVNWKNIFCSNDENSKDTINAIAAVTNASTTYCMTNWPRAAPKTFLILTSFARFTERAMAKLT